MSTVARSAGGVRVCVFVYKMKRPGSAAGDEGSTRE